MLINLIFIISNYFKLNLIYLIFLEKYSNKSKYFEIGLKLKLETRLIFYVLIYFTFLIKIDVFMVEL